jgi:hypothetical protein
MDLNEALRDIAKRFDMDADRLIAHAREDTLPIGWAGGHEYLGSIWREEGQILYALARELFPARVYEFGTNNGVSAAHISAAISANGEGSIFTSIDIEPEVGRAIPDHLRKYVAMVTADARTYEMQPCELVFEDASHTASLVEAIVKNIQRTPMQSDQRIIIHHDVNHYIQGKQVREGLARAGVENYAVYNVGCASGPNTTGLAIWEMKA